MKEKELLLFKELSEKTTITEIQEYFKVIFELRGFGQDTIEKKVMLLVEEIGELVKAIRKEKKIMGIDYEQLNHYSEVEGEIADVFIVLLSICNICEIDLFQAVKNKEEVNVERKWTINK